MANLSNIITPTNVLTATSTNTVSNKTIAFASNTFVGALAVANGGTGLTSTPSAGQLDIGNGTGFTRATLTAGDGVSITNGAGSVTIAVSGATISSIPFAYFCGSFN